MRSRMFASRAAGQAFALATIIEADGGPRPVGTQMVIANDAAYGYLSGGCIEADVALHARIVLEEGSPRRLVYGRGSPFIDMRLPCGGRLEVLIERISPDDIALAELERLTYARLPADWISDGVHRCCNHASDDNCSKMRFDPYWRLAVIGEDPFALAVADLAGRSGWITTLVTTHGPKAPPPIAANYSRQSVGNALGEFRPDAWSGVVVATHDLDGDHAALVAALRSDASYVGVLGARRRIPERIARLRKVGIPEHRILSLHAPVGLSLGAANALEVAVAVVAELIAHRRQARPARQA